VEWRSQIFSRNKIGPFLLIHFEPHQLLHMAEGSVVVIRVALNYNYQTFLPTQKPFIGPIMMRKYGWRPTTSEEAHFVIVLLAAENEIIINNYST
jgi:hypothetical protein